MKKAPRAPAGATKRTRTGPLIEALVIGLIVAALGALSSLPPVDRSLDRAGHPFSTVDLSLLFALRGDVAAPQDMMVVAVDETSAWALGLPSNPRDWPRYWHACLVDRLAKRGAAVISFDLFFSERRRPDLPLDSVFLSRSACRGIADAIDAAAAERRTPSASISAETSHDQVLADIIRRHAKPGPASTSQGTAVLLYEHTDQTAMVIDGVEIRKETTIAPPDSLSRAATGIAPFVVPMGRVDRFWPVKRIAGKTRPTLPFLAVQAFAARHLEPFAQRLRRAGLNDLVGQLEGSAARRDLGALMGSLAAALESQPDLGARVLDALTKTRDQEAYPTVRRELDAWRAVVKVYAKPREHFLYFYGSPGTVTTLSYSDVLDDAAVLDVADKAVFVGVSDITKVDTYDTFDTVFSTRQDVQLSGVEIAATAFANLLGDSTLRRPPAAVLALVLMAFGVLAGILAILARGWLGVLAAAALWCAYLIIALRFFEYHAVWLPVTIPLLQVLAALLMSYAWRYLAGRQELAFVTNAFLRFVPVAPTAASMRRSCFGTVLFSDLKSFTTIGEKISPERLIDFLNEYYAVVTPPIENNGGVVTQIQGDAILAVFNVIKEDPDHAASAVRAAREMHRAIDGATFLDGIKVSARIGINSGDMMASAVGSEGLSTYTVQGDAVNVAARLEELNKRYGTRVLLGQKTVGLLADHSMCRELGEVKIRGKRKKELVYELRLDM